MTSQTAIIRSIAENNLGLEVPGYYLVIVLLWVLAAVIVMFLLGEGLKAKFDRDWIRFPLNIVLAVLVAGLAWKGMGLFHGFYPRLIDHESEVVLTVLHGDFDVASVARVDDVFEVQSTTMVLGHRLPKGDSSKYRFVLSSEEASALQKELQASADAQDQNAAARLAGQ